MEKKKKNAWWYTQGPLPLGESLCSIVFIPLAVAGTTNLLIEVFLRLPRVLAFNETN